MIPNHPRRELLDQPQEFHGYIGPVLWTEERVDGCINVLFERVKWTGADEATVCIGTTTGIDDGPQEFHGYCGPVLWTGQEMIGPPSVVFGRFRRLGPDEASIRIGNLLRQTRQPF
ncbi:MAG: hypothetical protein IT368_14490 [Candidatus Hydrogenedentes bacterium]|nr:hypothetical protein [Candidatus Hydrogenedentota bacterium]